MPLVSLSGGSFGKGAGDCFGWVTGVIAGIFPRGSIDMARFFGREESAFRPVREKAGPSLRW